MKKFIAVLVSLVLFSCAAGPVQMAKTEQESIKTTYDEMQLRDMYDRNKPLLHDIYSRLRASKMDIYKEGIGFTTLKDEVGAPHYYLMINIRPPEIFFDEGTTKPEQRFAAVMGRHVEKYLRTYVKKADIKRSGAEGISLGVYWPVRDFTQCKENGGFIEYAIIFISNEDLDQMEAGIKTYQDVTTDTEIIVSLNLKPPVHMRPVYQ